MAAAKWPGHRKRLVEERLLRSRLAFLMDQYNAARGPGRSHAEAVSRALEITALREKADAMAVELDRERDAMWEARTVAKLAREQAERERVAARLEAARAAGLLPPR